MHDLNIPANLHQPIPFAGFEQYDSNASRSRKDCEMRFELIRKHVSNAPDGKITDLSMVDIGCANGYFSFRFLQEGGKKASGIEKDRPLREFANELAELKRMPFKVVNMLKDLDPSETYDVGLYFDLHFHDGINALPWIGPRVKTLFASCSGDGNQKSKPMFDELKNYYENVHQIGVSISNRAIFLCSGQRLKLEVTSKAKAEEQTKPETASSDPVSEPKSKGKKKTKNENSNPPV